MSLVTRTILSATLKAEALRIRTLRDTARMHLGCARRATDNDFKDKHYDLWSRIESASVCPSERARCANIALGFLRGTPYRAIEFKTRRSTVVTVSSLFREVASKAGAPNEAVHAWMLIPPTQEMVDAYFKAHNIAAEKRKRVAERRKTNHAYATGLAASVEATA